MLFFSKPTYKEMTMSFIHDCYSDGYDVCLESGLIDIEAQGIIDGVQKYFYESFILKKPSLYDNGDYEQMLELLKDSKGREVTVRLKHKKDRLKDFEILPESLAKAYNDSRFLELQPIGRGINDVSCRKID